MTVSSAVRKAGPFAGNGVSTQFPFAFKVFDKTNVAVIRADALGAGVTLMLDSDYSVTLNADQNNTPGGTITYPISGLPLPAASTLTLLGALAYNQPTDITNSGGFYPTIIEDALDRTEIQIQQLAEIGSRAIQVPPADGTTSVLPAAGARAGTVIGFDSTGALTLLPIPATVGAGNLTSEGPFLVGVTFTPDVTTTLPLSKAYGFPANVQVHFDGVYQGPDQYTLVGSQIVFNSPIPSGVSTVYVVGGTSLSVYVPTADAQAPQGTKLYNRINDFESVKDFGAVGDGAHNDTANVAAAMNSIKAGGSLFFPEGNYSCDPMVFQDFVFTKIFGFDATITLRSPGTLMTFHNAQRSRITGLTFQSAGAAQSLAASSGVLFDQLSGTCQVDTCNFFNFSNDGLQIDGETLATGLSGFKVMNNYFQGNGRYQFWMRYSNDWHLDKNQYGIFDGLPSHAQKGCFLQNCAAGRYTENLHWQNGVGFHDQGGNYNCYANNRIEMSDQQNVILENCNYGSFLGNQPHTASEASPGSSDSVQMIGCANMILADTNGFSFEPTVHFARYGINVDANSTNVTLHNNRMGDGSWSPAFGPYRVDGSAAPTANFDFDLTACSQSAIGPNSNVFMGSAGTNTVEKATHWVVMARSVVMRLFAAVDTPPGAGQTFTYTVRLNGVATAMTAVIAGGNFASDVGTITLSVVVPANSFVTVGLQTSSGAASAFHRVSLSFAEY